MPKLWSETIESHRHEVQQAILDTTARLVHRDGIRGVTMSQIAEEVRIGRATLYKYYSDVEAILLAWHEREVATHLQALSMIAHGPGRAVDRLRSVLEGFAAITRASRDHDPEVGSFLHRNSSDAEDSLRALIRGLLNEAAAAGDIRTDAKADELANFCLHAVGAAGSVPSKAAENRLVAMVMDGLKDLTPHRGV